MNDADFAEAFLDGLEQVLFHNDRDLARLERVQVNRVLDRHLCMRLV